MLTGGGNEVEDSLQDILGKDIERLLPLLAPTAGKLLYPLGYAVSSEVVGLLSGVLPHSVTDVGETY